jgi:SAM-dependent methyltransferase
MLEFWESSFIDKQTMWGLEPSNSAVAALQFFNNNGSQNVLVLGFGYGRNAVVFEENGMDVTGIEISQTAIDLFRKIYESSLPVFHGSVLDMPFDNIKYDAIFSHAMLHLFDYDQRQLILTNSYNQLKKGGLMIFSVITKDYPNYGKGTELSIDRYETIPGVPKYYYDQNSIDQEFTQFGLIKKYQINEKSNSDNRHKTQKIWVVICKKS